MKFLNLKIYNSNNLFYIFLALSSILLLYFQRQYSFFITLKITLLFFLLFSPIFFHKIYFNESKLLIPYLYIFCFLLFFFYCLGFFTKTKFDFFDAELINQVINILLLSFSSLFAGYSISNFFLKKKTIRINFFLRNNKINFILYISSIYLLFFYMFNLLNNIKYAVFLKNTFLYLFIVSLAYLVSLEKKKLKKILFFFIYIIIILIEASSSSIFFSIFSFLCFIFCLFFLNKKKLAIIALLFLFFFASLFQFSKYHQRLELFRLSPKNNYENSILFFKSINHILKDLYVVITNEPKNTHSQINEIIITQEKKIDHIEAAKSRLFHSLNVFLIVVKKTPEKTNYYFGKSYEGLIYVFVPRILLPSKPEQLYGHFWGKRYEVLDVSDNITSWNFPVLAEFYANFGIIGCILGMFFVGCILRIISTPIVNDKKNNIDGNLISISIFFQFIYQEINLTLILGNIFVSLILTTVIIFATNKIFKA
jgi:hypothetical protein